MAAVAPLSLRERKKSATKERLFREALHLFRQKGFAATTVEEIAAAAEVAKGTFFNYFPTKEAVLNYVGERQALASRGSVQAALTNPNLNTRQKIGRILTSLAATVEADRALTLLAVFEAVKMPDVVTTAPNRTLFRSVVTALLAEAQARGELRPELDPELVGSAIAGMYFYQLFEWCAAPEPYPLAAQLERLLDLLWEGVGNS